MQSKFLLHLAVVDEATGRERSARDIPVLKGLDPETRKKFLADALDRLFNELEKGN